MVFAWVVTVPAAALFTATIYFMAGNL